MEKPPPNQRQELTSDLKKEFHDLEYKELVCDHEQITSKEFYTCSFTKCSFRETVFTNCKFRDCIFINCDLNLAKVPDSLFQTTIFKSTQLIGINWAAAKWPKATFLKPFEFQECVLNYSTFIGLKLKGLILRKCVAKDVDFSEADLAQADCRDTDFSQSRFVETDLTAADFTHAYGYQINPNLVTLKGTKFSLPEAMALLYGLDIEITE